MKRILALILLLVIAGCGGGNDPQPAPAEPTTAAADTAEPTATGDLNTCAGLVQDEGRSCYSRELAAIVNGAGDPLAAVEGITKAAYADQSGFLLANWYFTPPYHQLSITDGDNALALVVYAVAAGIVALLVDRVGRSRLRAARLQAEAEALAALAGSLARPG